MTILSSLIINSNSSASLHSAPIFNSDFLLQVLAALRPSSAGLTSRGDFSNALQARTTRSVSVLNEKWRRELRRSSTATFLRKSKSYVALIIDRGFSSYGISAPQPSSAHLRLHGLLLPWRLSSTGL
jgi:hypothetical protein